ncbi:MAG: hypothetical protein EHM70_16590 [Chloroflexota bacterium]|nr:MAG: hypothetical protein EHM70_16590 [Chloroflexota bacterium]
MAHIEHVAIWTKDLERLRAFYETYFHARAGEKYTNPLKQYESYFLTFAGGWLLELMSSPAIPASLDSPMAQFTGYIHIALALESEALVDVLTLRLRQDGYIVVSDPRLTGDGYYESVILDPDGNRVEIMKRPP